MISRQLVLAWRFPSLFVTGSFVSLAWEPLSIVMIESRDRPIDVSSPSGGTSTKAPTLFRIRIGNIYMYILAALRYFASKSSLVTSSCSTRCSSASRVAELDRAVQSGKLLDDSLGGTYAIDDEEKDLWCTSDTRTSECWSIGDFSGNEPATPRMINSRVSIM